MLDDEISYEVGCMLEPMGVGVHGVSVGQVRDKTVAIYGCGPIGLMAIGAAKYFGAKKIFAVDVFDDKLKIAKIMGADVVINSKADNAVSKIIESTDGIGVDVSIDYTGNGRAITDGLTVLRKGGTFVLVGLPGSNIELDLTGLIIYKEVTMIGVTGRLMYKTWEECSEILKSPTFDIRPVVGGIYPMRDFEKAFDALFNGAPGKMILIP